VAVGAPGERQSGDGEVVIGAAPGADASTPVDAGIRPSAGVDPSASAPAGPTMSGATPEPLPPPSEPPPATPEQQMSAALEAIERGDFTTALALLGPLRGAQPTIEGLDDSLYRAHLGYGQQLLAEGRLDESSAEVDEALKLRDGDPVALEAQRQVLLARAWLTMETAWDNDEGVATAALEEILRLDSGYRDANVKLYAILVSGADRLIAAGDAEAALPLLMRAHEVYPEGDEARARLASYAPPPETAPDEVSNQPPSQAPNPAPASLPASDGRPAPARTSGPGRPAVPGSGQGAPPPEIPIPSGLPPIPKPGGLPLPFP
jgi:hypothetical protein